MELDRERQTVSCVALLSGNKTEVVSGNSKFIYDEILII